jgi:hypothetical protein
VEANKKAQVTISFSGSASIQPSALTVPTSAVPLAYLRKYSNPKPLIGSTKPLTPPNSK